MKEILAEIITIGDEILIGQIVDTNSAWMGKQLNTKGIKVNKISSISDSKEAIYAALDRSLKEVDLILITGGLGPTKDDITKHTLSEYFDMPLINHPDTYEKLKSFFNSRNMNFNELNQAQALLPSGCTVLENSLGTAQGMLFEKNEKIVVSMPGVPYEMKGLMEHEVLPSLEKYFDLPAIFHRTILTVGIPESDLAERIEAWANKLPEYIKLAYLPSYGQVRLRLSAFGEKLDFIKKEVLVQEEKLIPLIEKEVYGYNETSLKESVVQSLLNHKKTLATAESCTGGFIASSIVSIAGSSACFNGSVVAYHNDVKENLLHVNKESLLVHGAVSEEVVKQMAENVRKQLKTDIGIATSGIAGPEGGTDQKPVGTVWIALSDGVSTSTKLLKLGSNRETNIRRTTIYVLDFIRMYLNSL